MILRHSACEAITTNRVRSSEVIAPLDATASLLIGSYGREIYSRIFPILLSETVPLLFFTIMRMLIGGEVLYFNALRASRRDCFILDAHDRIAYGLL